MFQSWTITIQDSLNKQSIINSNYYKKEDLIKTDFFFFLGFDFRMFVWGNRLFLKLIFYWSWFLFDWRMRRFSLCCVWWTRTSDRIQRKQESVIWLVCLQHPCRKRTRQGVTRKSCLWKRFHHLVDVVYRIRHSSYSNIEV